MYWPWLWLLLAHGETSRWQLPISSENNSSSQFPHTLSSYWVVTPVVLLKVITMWNCGLLWLMIALFDNSTSFMLNGHCLFSVLKFLWYPTTLLLCGVRYRTSCRRQSDSAAEAATNASKAALNTLIKCYWLPHTTSMNVLCLSVSQPRSINSLHAGVYEILSIARKLFGLL